MYSCFKNGLFISDVKGNVAHDLMNTLDRITNQHSVEEYSDACKAFSIWNIISKPSTNDYTSNVE